MILSITLGDKALRNDPLASLLRVSASRRVAALCVFIPLSDHVRHCQDASPALSCFSQKFVCLFSCVAAEGGVCSGCWGAVSSSLKYCFHGNLIIWVLGSAGKALGA